MKHLKKLIAATALSTTLILGTTTMACESPIELKPVHLTVKIDNTLYLPMSLLKPLNYHSILVDTGVILTDGHKEIHYNMENNIAYVNGDMVITHKPIFMDGMVYFSQDFFEKLLSLPSYYNETNNRILLIDRDEFALEFDNKGDLITW